MSKEELKNRLRVALNIRGKRPVDLCTDLDLAKSTVSQYLSGKSKNMDADRLQAIGEYLNVSEAWLMGYDVPMERRPKKQDTIDYESYGLKPVHKKMIPVIGEIACGLPEDAIEIPIDIVEGEEYDADYALTAKGDSMTGAEIYEGDIILIKTMPTVNNGEIAAVRIDGSTTLKYVYWYQEKSQLVLQAANPAYPPLSYEGEALKDVEILGRAVKLQRNI